MTHSTHDIPPLAYVQYAVENYTHARHNLASSNVPPLKLSELQPPPHLLDLPPYELDARVRERIATLYNTTSDCVATTFGCTHANFLVNLALSLLHPNQEILCETPSYEPLWATPELFGLCVARFTRHLASHTTPSDPQKTAEHLRQAITPQTCAAWITNPHNPSGTTLDNTTLNTIQTHLHTHNALLLVDEIYHDFQHPPGTHSAFHLGDNVVVTSSLTKVYGLGNLRLGWVIAPPHIIRNIHTLKRHSHNLPPSPSLAFFLHALDNLDTIQHQATAHLPPRLPFLAQTFAHHPHVTWHPPEHGVVGLLEFKAPWDDLDFAHRLLNTHALITAPGSFFGAPSTLRLGFGTHSPDFEQSISILLRFIDEYAQHLES